MKVIILAAGLGKRLDQESDNPKPLTQLACNRSILALQLDTLSQFLNLDSVTIVVGYQFEAIMKQFPRMIYFYNPDFASENTAGSLRKALRKVDEDVLWLNGDVVFHPIVLKSLLNFSKTAMIVNTGKVGEEEVKYRTDAQGKILEVSKQVKKPEGEALGINFFSKEDLPVFKYYLERCHASDYFEKGIELAIQKGLTVTALPVEHSMCCEIDFPEDLSRANDLLNSWEHSPYHL